MGLETPATKLKTTEEVREEKASPFNPGGIYMIKKSLRLNSSEVNSVKKTPLKLKDRGLLVLYMENDLNHPKLSVVVSKKISLLAVERNRIKRKLVGLIKPLVDQYKQAGVNMLFCPSKGFIGLSKKDQKEVLSRVFNDLCSKKQ